MADASFTTELLKGFIQLSWQNLVMMGVGGVLIYLAIVKEYEPVLLLPIGAGAILANIPANELITPEGMFGTLYSFGIKNELFPLLIFIGVGAMTDFGPLLERPYTVILGAAAQFGIFGTLLLATLFGFHINEAASIGIIGAADWSHVHLRGLGAGSELAGAYYGGGLLLYVACSDHSAAYYADADNAG